MSRERVYRAPNFTQFPNEIFDELMAVLSGAEFKVLCYIARRTFGFGKAEDSIALKQICTGIIRRDGVRLDNGTGLSRSTAKESVLGLEKGGYIHVERSLKDGSGESDINRYSITVEVEAGVGSAVVGGGPEIGLPYAGDVGRKSAHGGPEIGLPGGPKIGPTKESITKESLQSSSTPPQSPEPEQKPPQREEEEVNSALRAVNAYVVAGPDFARRLRAQILTANPNLSAGQIADVIHRSVPQGYRVESPGFFVHSVSDVARSPRFHAVADPKPAPPVDQTAAIKAFLEANAQAVRAAGFEGVASSIEDLSGASEFDLEKLELDLATLEQNLIAIAREAVNPEILELIRAENEKEIKPHRKKMTAAQIAMLEKQHMDRAILERWKLPRLSLFYMR